MGRRIDEAWPVGISLGLTIGCLIGGAGLGMATGYGIGIVAPGYYHTVFGDPNLDAVQVGLGLGITQGLGAGFVLAAILILGNVFLVGRAQRRDALGRYTD